MKDKVWHGAEGCYSIFGKAPFPLYALPLSIQQYSRNRKEAINLQNEKNIFNSKLEQFLACTPL
jgi:hypothetical protein